VRPGGAEIKTKTHSWAGPVILKKTWLRGKSPGADREAGAIVKRGLQGHASRGGGGGEGAFEKKEGRWDGKDERRREIDGDVMVLFPDRHNVEASRDKRRFGRGPSPPKGQERRRSEPFRVLSHRRDRYWQEITALKSCKDHGRLHAFARRFSKSGREEGPQLETRDLKTTEDGEVRKNKKKRD